MGISSRPSARDHLFDGTGSDRPPGRIASCAIHPHSYLLPPTSMGYRMLQQINEYLGDRRRRALDPHGARGQQRPGAPRAARRRRACRGLLRVAAGGPDLELSGTTRKLELRATGSATVIARFSGGGELAQAGTGSQGVDDGPRTGLRWARCRCSRRETGDIGSCRPQARLLPHLASGAPACRNPTGRINGRGLGGADLASIPTQRPTPMPGCSPASAPPSASGS